MENTECNECGKIDNVFNLDFKNKLGKCPFCIAASIAGTVFGWFFAYASLVVLLNPIMYWFFVSVASLFSLLLLAHIIAFLINNKKSQ